MHQPKLSPKKHMHGNSRKALKKTRKQKKTELKEQDKLVKSRETIIKEESEQSEIKEDDNEEMLKSFG